MAHPADKGSEQTPGVTNPLARIEAQNLERARRFVNKTNGSMDTMMVFAGLFSAVIAQFIAITSSDLKADTNYLTNRLLYASVTLQQRPNATIPDIIEPEEFQASMASVAVNALFFFSLILSLLSALGAMMVKQWVGRYENHGAEESLLHKRTRIHAETRLNMESWHLKQAIACVPYALHLALAVFLGGTLIWTFTLNTHAVIPSFVLVGFAAIAYFCIGSIPLLPESQDTPSRTGPRRPRSRLGGFWNKASRAKVEVEEGMEQGHHAIDTVAKSTGQASIAMRTTFVLNPTSDTETQGDQHRPSTPDLPYAMVWINAIKDTKKHDELLEAFHELRIANWGHLNLREPLFRNGDVILGRCRDVARAQWHGTGGQCSLHPGSYERVRNICLFIEWFYYQISVEQRRSLRGWPDSGIAKALAFDPHYGEDPPPGGEGHIPSLEDLTLSSSVVAKLHHVRLVPNEACDMCIVEKREPGDVRLRLSAARDPRVYTDNDRIMERFPWLRRMQRLVSAQVSSDADCLLNYTGGIHGRKLERRIEGSRELTFLCITSYATAFPKATSFVSLRNMLASLRLTAREVDLRTKWLDEVLRYVNWSEQPEEDCREEGEGEGLNAPEH